MTLHALLLQEGFTIEDDFGATDDFTRENDVEEEFQRARRQAEEENARKRAEDGPSYPEADAGPTIASNGQQGKHKTFLLIQGTTQEESGFTHWIYPPLFDQRSRSREETS